MAGLLIIATALLAALASFGDAATLPAREPVKPSSVLCSQASGPFPNPQDCGSFLQCEPSGRIVTHDCPKGLEFNAWERVCDYPESARCSSGGGNPHPPPPHDNKPPAEDNKPPAEDNKPPAEDNKPPAEAPKCPAIENPEEAVQLPNPNDCHSFYKCDASGVAWLNSCPAGLEYNARLRVCDFPENAGCSQPAPVENPAEDEPVEEDNAEDNAAEVEEPAPPPADAPKCPAIENPEEAIQLVNPSDCSSFYKCDESGVAWLISCPAGLEYNAKLRVCDFPVNAGCSQPAPVEIPAEDEPVEGDNAEDNAGEVEEPAPPPADAPKCPAIENPEEAIQLVNPSDCGSFYKCDENGVAWLIPCPAGLHYNAELRVCDYAANAGCSSD